jgi:hypothetical protein
MENLRETLISIFAEYAFVVLGKYEVYYVEDMTLPVFFKTYDSAISYIKADKNNKTECYKLLEDKINSDRGLVYHDHIGLGGTKNIRIYVINSNIYVDEILKELRSCPNVFNNKNIKMEFNVLTLRVKNNYLEYRINYNIIEECSNRNKYILNNVVYDINETPPFEKMLECIKVKPNYIYQYVILYDKHHIVTEVHDISNHMMVKSAVKC